MKKIDRVFKKLSELYELNRKLKTFVWKTKTEETHKKERGRRR